MAAMAAANEACAVSAFAMRARESGNFPMWFGGMRSDPARSRRASAHHGRGVVFGVYLCVTDRNKVGPG